MPSPPYRRSLSQAERDRLTQAERDRAAFNPPTDRMSSADDPVQEIQSEDTGVHGEPLERLEKRQRNANLTLDSIRKDQLSQKELLAKHSEIDEASFAKVEKSIIGLTEKHAAVLGKLGELSGGQAILVQLTADQTKAAQNLAADTRRQVELAEAAVREDKRLQEEAKARLALAANEANAKLASAKLESNAKLWKTIIAGILAIALAIIAGLVGHGVK